LEHEAKLLVRLQHAHIASLRGYLKDSSPIFGEDRGPCFWMEYVEGDDLPAAASKRPREKRDDEKRDDEKCDDEKCNSKTHFCA